MALVIRGSGFDDVFAYPYGYTGYGYGGNLVPFSAYSAYNPFAPGSLAGALAPRPAKSFNPFKSNLPNYGGQIGAPNNIRPQLRPPNDRLDRLTRMAVEKLDLGAQALRGLADDADRLKTELRDADTGGEAELREQLRLANMEIHRLRTLMLTGVGKEAEVDQFQQYQQYQQQQFQQEQSQEYGAGEPGQDGIVYEGQEGQEGQEQYEYQQDQIAPYGYEGQEGAPGQIQYDGYAQ